ncbi:caldesmon [Arthroderma uncinatum]|uniref:caldesmon n=1 Tax=Arthroderma uncinatum TaxID=74035 RepID=UPI00144AB9FA|nr:caldesmon [Arthroderma uncinatum]KAF3491530.1 caldesmon [Arthroderma uncinatum]
MPSNSKRPAAVPTSSLTQNSSASTAKQTATLKPLATTTSDSTTANAGSTASAMLPAEGTTGVNKKKQKRRQKLAARLAAEQQRSDSSTPTNRNGQDGSDGYDNGVRHAHAGNSTQHRPNERSEPIENAEAWYSDDDRHFSHSRHEHKHDNHGSLDHQHNNTGKGKSKKKKGKKGRTGNNAAEGSSTSHSTPPPPPLTSSARPVGVPPPLVSAYRSAHRISKDRIWNTSTHEERENIKEFWLQLGEEERRSLVKVEKEAVLRKMKEQQKHSCSCTVCGRKRTAIEEELEVLYDAYYEELEQYANNNQASFENGGSLRLPPRLYQTPIRSLDHHPHLPGAQHPSRGRVHELPDDDDEDELDEEYEEDEEEEDDEESYSEDELDIEARTSRADFFAFGNSLTVKDGILTVADDLLKNDGKHFIDMMEQLAERRMQREEETQYIASSAAHQSMQAGHNHGAPLDEEDYDDDEDDDYDSQEEDEFEEDEMDAMTEEQRMEEGRRMFQIFAARMFEQRVLTAYREKVARERQQRLIEELEEENRLDEEREAKKAKEAQKKKDKKRLQKQAKDEERAKREAERAAEAAAQKAAEDARVKEQQRKKEEQRKKREAEKKAQEEERLRKEADRQKRLKDERERQAEADRKQREQKEKEKKKREEAKKKEREEREAKEKEARERKAREDREQKNKAELEKRGKDSTVNREQSRRDEFGSLQPDQHLPAQNLKRTSQPGMTYFPPGLHHPQPPSLLQSPHFQVATPVIPKAPTPVRARQASQQGSHASSPRSQPAYIDTLQTSISPGAAHSSGASSVVSNKGVTQYPNTIHNPQPSVPMSPLGGPGRGQPPPGFGVIPSLNGIPGAGMPAIGHRSSLGHETSMYPNQPNPIGSQFRGIGSPEGLSAPPGIAPRHPGQGRGFSLDPSHSALPYRSPLMSSGPLAPHPVQAPREALSQMHGPGQLSTSFERSPNEPLPLNQPIGSRPAPIQRPSSTVHDHGKEGSHSNQPDVDELSTQLGSSALLDDTDVPLNTAPSQPIPAPGPGRMSFGTNPLFSESLGSTNAPNFPLGAPSGGSPWGSGMSFGPPGFPSSASWGAGPSPTWANNAFGVIGRPHHSYPPRPVTIRLLVSQACKQLSANSPGGSGFHSTNQVLRQIEQLNSPLDTPVSLDEMLDICDTEGNPQNGGGSLIVDFAGPRGTFIKFEPDSTSPLSGTKPNTSPGDIGSPVSRNSYPANIGSGGGATGSGGPNARYFSSMNVPPPTY